MFKIQRSAKRIIYIDKVVELDPVTHQLIEKEVEKVKYLDFEPYTFTSEKIEEILEKAEELIRFDPDTETINEYELLINDQFYYFFEDIAPRLEISNLDENIAIIKNQIQGVFENYNKK